MKRLALLLALILCLSACAEIPPPADTAPPRPAETTAPVETTQPPETTSPVVSDPFEEWYALLDFAEYPETNWLRNAMGCVFTAPDEIDLEFLFYAGFRDGSWDKLSPESEAALIEQGFWRDMDLQPMPVSKIEDVLNSTLASPCPTAPSPMDGVTRRRRACTAPTTMMPISSRISPSPMWRMTERPSASTTMWRAISTTPPPEDFSMMWI